jgi:mono/diheme cytochrome c family protein
MFGRRAALCLLLAACCLLALGCRQDMQDQPRYEAYEPSKSFGDGQSSRPFVEGTVARGYRDINTSYYTGKQASGATTGGAQGLMNGSGNALQATMANAQGGSAGAQAAGGGDVNVRGQNVGANVPNGAGGGTAGQSGTPGSINEFPFPIAEKDLDRGQERFEIYCAMCHGATGYGDGMIVRRGFRHPPSLHDDRLRGETVGHFFDVITNGWGAMPDYSQQIPVEDRWKIIAYIRALQLSQNTPVAEVPEHLRNQRKPTPGTPGTQGGHQGAGGERTP